MGWNQRNARFYCEVDATDKQQRRILSDDRLHIVAAGEHGMLRVVLRQDGIEEKMNVGPRGGRVYTRRNIDKFLIEFCPWRKTDSEARTPVVIASGPLDYDRVKHGEAMVRFDDRAIEVYRTIRAMEVMSE
jgi:hypothetical protein